MTFDDLPKGHFGAILADPPWHFQAWASPPYGKGRAAESHYNTMKENELNALPVHQVAADDCVLFLWTCWPMLQQSLRVLDAWGFKYKTCAFSWLKADPYRLFALEEDVWMGLGYWTRSNTEPCLLATRGKPKRTAADVRQGLIEKAREHSRKPDCVHERIERLVAGPYLELFARQTRPGWTSWGNEVNKLDSYNASDDFAKSLDEGYRAIRERVANGGEPWRPK